MESYTYNVVVRPRAGGGYAATCDELPMFTAHGEDGDACNQEIMQQLLETAGDEIGDRLSLDWELRIRVQYQDVPAEVANTYNWEIFVPRHAHDAPNVN